MFSILIYKFNTSYDMIENSVRQCFNYPNTNWSMENTIDHLGKRLSHHDIIVTVEY